MKMIRGEYYREFNVGNSIFVFHSEVFPNVFSISLGWDADDKAVYGSLGRRQFSLSRWERGA